MFKYIKLLAQWKDVRKIYREEKGTDKPWYASRRFFGAVMVLTGGCLYVFLDVALPADLAAAMADNASVIGGLIKELVPAGVALYGAVTGLVGIIKKSKADDGRD